MFQDNPLLAQLKQQLRDNIPKKEGVVRGSDRGFGFLETDNRESYFIPPQQMKKVMHGDRITALIRTENEKEQAEPDSLITPFLTRFVGRIKLIKDRLNVVPDHPVLKEVIKARPIKGLDEKQFAEGDWVVANLKRHGLTGSMGRVGACGDNAAMESFFALLQKNVLDRRSWSTREELRLAIVSWIEGKYHRKRRQRRLGKLTPVEFELIMKPTARLAA